MRRLSRARDFRRVRCPMQRRIRKDLQMRTALQKAAAITGVVGGRMVGLGGCGDVDGSSSGSAPPANTKVGILLPDTATSPRWVSADPNELNKQCIAYKLTCYIDNANGS